MGVHCSPHDLQKELYRVVTFTVKEKTLLGNDCLEPFHAFLWNDRPLTVMPRSLDCIERPIHRCQQLAEAVFLMLEDDGHLLLFKLKFVLRLLQLPCETVFQPPFEKPREEGGRAS